MKGALVCYTNAVKALLRAGVRLKGDVIIAAVAGEIEKTQWGAFNGMEYLGFGGLREPVGASGIVSFGRTEIRRALGPWRTRAELASMQDSGLGAERDMILRYRDSGLRLEAFLRRIPVVADVVTDPRGTKARVRFGNRRYGRYVPPPEGDLYYRVRDESELEGFAGGPPAFEDFVRPLGFDLPLDESGNLLKTNVVDEDEPYELIE